MANKGTLQEKSWIIFIAAQNKAKIDYMQQNCKWRLCGDRYEKVNHIINEWCKLTQKYYKTRHDWVGNVIYWELCKSFKFDFIIKLFMHKPESVLKNRTHKIFWNFEMQILARRPDQVLIYKKSLSYGRVFFFIPAEHRKKKWKKSKSENNWTLRHCVLFLRG